MKHIYIAILAVGVFFSAKPVQAQTGAFIPELAAFDTAMSNFVKTYKVPGGQLAITYKGRLVYNRGFGYADTATQTLVEPNHIFRIASCSKPITGVTLMHLWQQGRFQLDDTVFGPRGILNDANYQTILDPRVRQITMRHLLTHSGGWNRDVSGDPMFNSYTIATAMSVPAPADAVTVIKYMLANKYLDFAPGTQYNYSNLGYCILGRVIEKLTGQGYGTYVSDSILRPMGITDMALSRNLLDNKLPNEVHYYDFPGSALGYSVYDNTTRLPWPYGAFNIEAMDAHGGWAASAEDLCKLLVSVDGFSSVPDMLAQATIDTMVKPSAANNYYACGWSVNFYNNWWHTGSLPGTGAEIVRSSGEINWAILGNTRPQNSDPMFTAMDQLVWNVLPRIKSWPSINLFSQVTNIEERFISSTTVYPVPANNYLMIKTDLGFESGTCQLFDESGRVLRSVNMDRGDFMLEVSSLSSGIYFVRITGQNSSEVKKVIIQH